MTFIELDDAAQTKILIDMNIRQRADDEDDPTFDVAGELRSRLKKDGRCRPYVDVLVQTHPDQDHISGLQNHFHLGPPDAYVDPAEGEEPKILIHEIWSSPIVWRRADRRTGHTLCEDAKAFNTEAKRRVKLYREWSRIGDPGDRIRIIGEDENGKTDGLDPILVRVDEAFTRVNERDSGIVEIYVLGPLAAMDDEEREDLLAKNRSSVILQFRIASAPGQAKNNWFICAGDAEVAIWKELWSKHGDNTTPLRYDILLTPHHCSWHSLSEDSWSKSKNPQVDPDARSALGQAEPKARLIASSKPIKDDKNDPPCWGAKKEYESIASRVKGEFLCTGEYPTSKAPEPLEIRLTASGPQMGAQRAPNITAVAGTAAAASPKAHG